MRTENAIRREPVSSLFLSKGKKVVNLTLGFQEMVSSRIWDAQIFKRILLQLFSASTTVTRFSLHFASFCPTFVLIKLENESYGHWRVDENITTFAYPCEKWRELTEILPLTKEPDIYSFPRLSYLSSCFLVHVSLFIHRHGATLIWCPQGTSCVLIKW